MLHVVCLSLLPSAPPLELCFVVWLMVIASVAPFAYLCVSIFPAAITVELPDAVRVRVAQDLLRAQDHLTLDLQAKSTEPGTPPGDVERYGGYPQLHTKPALSIVSCILQGASHRVVAFARSKLGAAAV